MTPHTEADLDLMDVRELERLVVHLATLYDQGLPCVDFDADPVTDPHYDTLVRVLRRRAPNCEAFAKGTTSPSTYDPSGDLVTHNPPMTSIAKADGDLDQKTATLKKWVADAQRDLRKSIKVVRSFKHDGVAVRLYYEKGKLVRAGLRPRKGLKGIDVTKNIVYVKGVPAQLPLPLTLAIGGELECSAGRLQRRQQGSGGGSGEAAGEPPQPHLRRHQPEDRPQQDQGSQDQLHRLHHRRVR
jgi:NAD-dependent DNA ligase